MMRRDTVNAHALHGVPPPSVAPEPSAQPSQPVPVPANQLKDDALNHAESKIDEDKLQKIDDERNDSPNSASDDSSESDSSAEEEDELDAVRPMLKLPIQFDLDELAGAFLANNQKGRMNCVVEKRRDDPMERRFLSTSSEPSPRAALTPSASPSSATEATSPESLRPMNFPEPQSQVFAFPLTGPVRLPLRPQPERAAPPAAGPAPRMPPFAPMTHRQAPFLPVST
ncbi:WW domain-binding protein 11-like [Helicoverpa armigera]|uniref:WW domain-binding protein 11-like n=1 Tax=Helicoverpa armigera TaxID=29058 RepID=UPI0030839721